MTKTGEVKKKVTRCDYCSKAAVAVDGYGNAYCLEHLQTKRASVSSVPLKSSTPELANEHKPE